MSTPPPPTGGAPSAHEHLKTNALGARGIAFLVVAAAAPLTVMAGVAPLAILVGGIGAPVGYLGAGAVLHAVRGRLHGDDQAHRRRGRVLLLHHPRARPAGRHGGRHPRRRRLQRPADRRLRPARAADRRRGRDVHRRRRCPGGCSRSSRSPSSGSSAAAASTSARRCSACCWSPRPRSWRCWSWRSSSRAAPTALSTRVVHAVGGLRARHVRACWRSRSRRSWASSRPRCTGRRPATRSGPSRAPPTPR